MNSWSETAKLAIQNNPDYFVWWYTVKSIGLCLCFGALTYSLGYQKGKSKK